MLRLILMSDSLYFENSLNTRVAIALFIIV